MKFFLHAKKIKIMHIQTESVITVTLIIKVHIVGLMIRIWHYKFSDFRSNTFYCAIGVMDPCGITCFNSSGRCDVTDLMLELLRTEKE